MSRYITTLSSKQSLFYLFRKRFASILWAVCVDFGESLELKYEMFVNNGEFGVELKIDCLLPFIGKTRRGYRRAGSLLGLYCRFLICRNQYDHTNSTPDRFRSWRLVIGAGI